MTVQIQEFRFNASPWRIDWLGAIRYPASAQSEPRITVYLTELVQDYKDPMSNGPPSGSRRREHVSIKVGQIALLKIGSVWIDGIEAPVKTAIKGLECVLRQDQLNLVRFDSHVEINGQSQPLFTEERYRIGDRAHREVAASWVALAYDPTPKVKLLVIPSTVIFQKSLATSPKAVRRLVYGEIDKIVDPNCGFLDDEPDTYYINLFKDFRDPEGKAMANLRADPIAHREFQRFRHSLVADSVNQDRGPDGSYQHSHVKLGLPFSNAVEIAAIGKFLPFKVEKDGKSETIWGFLAAQLVSIRTRLVFTRLVIDRKNNAQQGKNAEALNLLTSWRIEAKTPTSTLEPTQPITSAVDPDEALEKLCLEAAGDFEAIELEEIHQEKDVQKYRSSPRSARNASDPNGEATTGDLTGNSSSTTEADLCVHQPPLFPVTLDQFVETLHLLKQRGYAFETVTVSTSWRKHANERDVVNFLPRLIKGVRSWHLVAHAGRLSTRGYIVAEARRGDTWHYLLELERKGQETFALMHFRAHNGDRIPAGSIEHFMINVAKANGWSAAEDYKNWVCEPIKHTPSRGAKFFAQSIASRL